MRRAILLAALLLPLAMLPPSEAQVPGLVITSTLDPGAMTPGTQGTLFLTIENPSNLTLTSFRLNVEDAPEGIEVLERRGPVGGIGPGGSSTFAWRVDVDENVTVGRYLVLLELRYCIQGEGCDDYDHTASIVVVDGRQLVFEGVRPSSLPRAETTDLVFSVHNPLTGRIRDLTVTWAVPDGAVLPVGEVDRFDVAEMDAGTTVELRTPVAVAPDAEAGIHAVFLNATYRDATGAVYRVSAQLGVVIGGATAFEAGDARMAEDMLTFTLANIGLEDADAVVVRALDRNGSVIGTSFLGTLDAGDYATVTMDLGGPRAALLEVDHSDALGERSTQTMPLSAREPPPADPAPEPSLLSRIPGWGYLLLGAGIVVIVSAVLRRRRRRDDDL